MGNDEEFDPNPPREGSPGLRPRNLPASDLDRRQGDLLFTFADFPDRALRFNPLVFSRASIGSATKPLPRDLHYRWRRIASLERWLGAAYSNPNR